MLFLEDKSRPLLARKPIGLALQGGGSWGAYTWGVLDSVLASRSVEITQLSGTSAGAINAAIVASALAKGSPTQARKSLREFWLGIAHSPVADFGRSVWGPVERAWRDSVATWLLAHSSLSPYTTNPLNINPLRDAIVAHVDIEAIRSKASPALYVTVTNVKTGLPRVIANDAMSIDALLASACLPTLFQAVEIDGEPYWDGGYCGNPTLWPMIHSGAARDLVVVQLVPDVVTETPRDATAIRQRIGEIVFNSSLVAEMQAIAAMRAIAERGEGPSGVRDLRLHRIGPPPRNLIEGGSAGERSHAALLRLHDEGRVAARQFIERHGVDIGVRETLAIGRVYSDGRKPKMHTQAPDLVVGAPGTSSAAQAQPAAATAA
jgi:NTE family protein